MFSLEQQIGQWRSAMDETGTYRGQDLDELESHLRDSIADLGRRGLSEQEAWAVACQRMGQPSCLAQEFAKVHAGLVLRRRLLWMCIGVLGYLMISQGAAALSGLLALGAALLGLKGLGLAVFKESAYLMGCGTILTLGWVVLSRQVKATGRSSGSLPLGLKILLLATVAGLMAAQFVVSLLMARVLGAQDFGRMGVVSAYTGFALRVVGPLLLMGVAIRLGRRGSICQ